MSGVQSFTNYKAVCIRSVSHTPQPKPVRDPTADPSTKAAGLAQLLRAFPGQSGGGGSPEAPGPTLPLHRLLRSSEPQALRRECWGGFGSHAFHKEPRAATCGCVPAELGAAGGRRAGQLSKKCQLPRLHSPRTDRCGPRCPGRSAPSSACPCQGSDRRLRRSLCRPLFRVTSHRPSAPPPAANHDTPRPDTCPPARPACPAPATPPG